MGDKLYNIKEKIKNFFTGIITFFVMHFKSYKIKVTPWLPYFDIVIPKYYNENGELLDRYFIHDYCTGPFNTVLGRFPKYFMWDRYTYTLPIRFFGHMSYPEMQKIQKLKKAKKNFYFAFESEGILPKLIHNEVLNEKNMEGFDAIFTPHKCVLDKYSNAYFVPGGGVHIGTPEGGGSFNDKQYENKSKNVSIVSSAKAQCQLHIKRKKLAEILKKNKMADTYGTFDGGKNIIIADSLTDYMYSIAIENYVAPYYFTEKILNCFASQTVPIYVGASDLSKFFNMDGVIYVKEADILNIPDIISKLDKDDYLKRKPAILDNYERVKKYLCMEDYIYENYKDIIYK